jgi:hypothetical protein
VTISLWLELWGRGGNGCWISKCQNLPIELRVFITDLTAAPVSLLCPFSRPFSPILQCMTFKPHIVPADANNKEKKQSGLVFSLCKMSVLVELTEKRTTCLCSSYIHTKRSGQGGWGPCC